MLVHLGKECGIIQSVCSFFKEGIEEPFTQHDFSASLVDPHSPDLSDSDTPFCPCNLDAFLTCATLIPFSGLGTSEPSHALHGHCALCTLCCASLSTSTNGLGCFCSHTGKHLTYVTCNCHLVVPPTEVGHNCLHVSI